LARFGYEIAVKSQLISRRFKQRMDIAYLQLLWWSGINLIVHWTSPIHCDSKKVELAVRLW